MSNCNWVDECFGRTAESHTEEGSNRMGLQFDPCQGQMELSGGLLPPTPPARVASVVNGGNPWAVDTAAMAAEKENNEKKPLNLPVNHMVVLAVKPYATMTILFVGGFIRLYNFLPCSILT